MYTSYFDNIENLPANVVPIAISGNVPEWYDGLRYKKLAPKKGFWSKWHETKDNNYYISHFLLEVLSNLNRIQVFKELKNMVPNDKEICLICYEKPDEFCHRHLVADWLEVVESVKEY